MKRCHFEEQLITASKQHQAGAKVNDICREFGVSKGIFHNWRKKYAGFRVNETKRLRE